MAPVTSKRTDVPAGRRRRRIILAAGLFLAAAVLLGWPATTLAHTVYTTGDDPDGNLATAWGIVRGGRQALRFTASADARPDAGLYIEALVGVMLPQPPATGQRLDLVAALYDTDGPDGLPGTLLGSAGLADVPALYLDGWTFVGGVAPRRGRFDLPMQLNAGSDYWLSVESPSGGMVVWAGDGSLTAPGN